MQKALKGKETQLEISTSDDMPVLEINPGNSWPVFIASLLLGISLAYGVIVIASSKGVAIPGVVTKKTVKEVSKIKGVPIEKVKIIEKPVYRDRIVERSVSVPVPAYPQGIWVDAPRNIPGCFPIFVHLSFGNRGSRSYQATVCGRRF